MPFSVAILAEIIGWPVIAFIPENRSWCPMMLLCFSASASCASVRSLTDELGQSLNLRFRKVLLYEVVANKRASTKWAISSTRRANPREFGSPICADLKMKLRGYISLAEVAGSLAL